MLNFTKCYPKHCINDYYSVEGSYRDKPRQAHLPFFLSKAYLAGFLEIIRCNYDFETAQRNIQIMDKYMFL